MQLAFGLAMVVTAAVGWGCWQRVHDLRTTVIEQGTVLLKRLHSIQRVRSLTFSLLVAADDDGRNRAAAGALLSACLDLEAAGRSSADEEYLLVSRLRLDREATIDQSTADEPNRIFIERRLKALAATAAELGASHRRAVDGWIGHLTTAHERLERDVLLVVTFGLGAGALLLLFAAPDVAGPLRRFLVCLRQIREANFTARVAVDEGHDLAIVAHEFNDTLDALEAFQRLHTASFQRERTAARHLAALVDVPVIVLDDHRRVVHMNGLAFDVLDVTSSDVVGAVIDEAPVPAELRALLQSCFLTGRRIVDAPVDRPEGPALRCSASAVRDADERTTAVVAGLHVVPAQ